MAKINEFDVGDIVWDSLLGKEHSPVFEILSKSDINDEVTVRLLSKGAAANTTRKIGDIFTKSWEQDCFTKDFHIPIRNKKVKLVLQGIGLPNYDRVDDVIKVFEYSSLEDAQKLFDEVYTHNEKEWKEYNQKLNLQVAMILEPKSIMFPQFKYFLRELILDTEREYRLYKLEDWIKKHEVTFQELVIDNLEEK